MGKLEALSKLHPLVQRLLKPALDKPVIANKKYKKCKYKCCCNCSNHHVLHSHPLVDNKPMSHKAGYVCITGEVGCILSNQHGLCELHEKGKGLL
jgi:hypothetical protein